MPKRGMRKFDGKWYTPELGFKKKLDAERYAKKQRKIKYYARIIKEKNVYRVFTRKNRM